MEIWVSKQIYNILYVYIWSLALNTAAFDMIEGVQEYGFGLSLCPKLEHATESNQYHSLNIYVSVFKCFHV